jgi:hypothetical protein
MMETEMNTRQMSRNRRSRVAFPLGSILAGLLLLPAGAAAQSAASSFTVSVADGLVGPAAGAMAAGGRESIACSGPVKVEANAMPDPALGPTVTVSVDARGLVCTGQTTRAAYVNTAQANLTRLLAPTDVVETTFALHRNVPGGFMRARTARLTLNLSYDATGALTGATASVASP